LWLNYHCFQYSAKEFQQALDVLDMEEPASKKLLDRSLKDEKGVADLTKDWGMSPASVSLI
jgi:anaphase-promoting complex subunit 6